MILGITALSQITAERTQITDHHKISANEMAAFLKKKREQPREKKTEDETKHSVHITTFKIEFVCVRAE